jgi:HrpA-like RNA helicase
MAAKLYDRDPERFELAPQTLTRLETALSAVRAAWPEQMAAVDTTRLSDGRAVAPPLPMVEESAQSVGSAIASPVDNGLGRGAVEGSEDGRDDGEQGGGVDADPPDDWDDVEWEEQPPAEVPVDRKADDGPRPAALEAPLPEQLPPAPPPDECRPPGVSDVELQARSSRLLDEHTARGESNRQYAAMQTCRMKLPAHAARLEIVTTVSRNAVVVVSGETGCGKTTQVPQFILDDAIERGAGAACNIVCTQPRRISAIGVAERVASERAQRVGEQCGYQVRLDRMASDRTQLLFCTTGILLRRLQNDPTLKGVSHIIMDEVHER